MVFEVIFRVGILEKMYFFVIVMLICFGGIFIVVYIIFVFRFLFSCIILVK